MSSSTLGTDLIRAENGEGLVISKSLIVYKDSSKLDLPPLCVCFGTPAPSSQEMDKVPGVRSEQGCEYGVDLIACANRYFSFSGWEGVLECDNKSRFMVPFEWADRGNELGPVGDSTLDAELRIDRYGSTLIHPPLTNDEACHHDTCVTDRCHEPHLPHREKETRKRLYGSWHLSLSIGLLVDIEDAWLRCSSPAQTVAGTSHPLHLESALAGSLVDGEFADVRFYLFTQHARSGKVGAPRALYANSTILKAASPYFHGLLAGGFSEGNANRRDNGFPDNQSIIDTYDYNSDTVISMMRKTRMKERAQNLPCPHARHPWENLHQLSLQSSINSEKDAALIVSTTGQSVRTILVKDGAHTTWQWLVFYIYTGKIGFAPLRSQGTRRRMVERERYRSEYPQRPVLCSPKSMYRLADKLGMDALKILAANDLRMKLSTENILDELFSQFTSWYPELLETQVEFFCDNCIGSGILPALEQKISAIVAGRSPHADAALTRLFRAWVGRAPTPKIMPALSAVLQSIPGDEPQAEHRGKKHLHLLVVEMDISLWHNINESRFLRLVLSFRESSFWQFSIVRGAFHAFNPRSYLMASGMHAGSRTHLGTSNDANKDL
ncbi:hypothetical protein BKA93DRAFT_752866 [Sparassis latifolia]